MPVPTRERKPALAALAVLLILGGALASAYLVMASGQRVSVIRVARPVAAGQQVPASALQEVQISSASGIDYIPWSRRADVTRTYATTNLVEGALLTNGMISNSGSAAKGTVVVGLALKPGQLPANGVRPGDRVAVYAVAAQGGQSAIQAGAILAPAATVFDVSSPGRNDVQSDQVQASVAVPADQAPQVTQAASAGAVAIALLPAGEQAPGAAPKPPGKTRPTAEPSQSAQPPGEQQPGGQQSTPPPGGH